MPLDTIDIVDGLEYALKKDYFVWYSKHYQSYAIGKVDPIAIIDNEKQYRGDNLGQAVQRLNTDRDSIENEELIRSLVKIRNKATFRTEEPSEAVKQAATKWLQDNWLILEGILQKRRGRL